MGLPALAQTSPQRTFTRPLVGLYNPEPEEPSAEEKVDLIKGPSPSPPSNLEIYEPFGGWQIFEKPVPEGDGNYSIKLGQKNLSTLNDNNKFARFQYELNSISSPSLKHLIINFVHCHNEPYDINRTGDIADFLNEKREGFKKLGKVLSLVHLEKHLYHETDLKSQDSFVHETLEHAIKNRPNGASLLPVPPNVENNPSNGSTNNGYPPFLKAFRSEDPANVTEMHGHYLG